MTGHVLAMFLSAGAIEGPGLSVDGAASAFVAPESSGLGSGSFSGGLHARLNAGYETESFFVEGRASFLATYNGAFAFHDLGSTLAVGWRPHTFLEELRLTLWPSNSVTALPVFDWANRIGNVDSFSPALSLQASTRAGSVWVTSRFGAWQNRVTQNSEVRPDLFFGINTQLAPGFQLDARAAWFQYGRVSANNVADGFVASGRLSWTHNEFVGPAMDLDLYGNDPWRFERFFVPETRVTRTALWLAVEGGGGAQKLIDSEGVGVMKSQPLGWFDVQLRARVSEVRLFLTGRLRTFSFDVANFGPSWPPYVALLNSSTLAPRLEALAGFDVTWREAKLTPGVLVRVTRPAYEKAQRFDFDVNGPAGFEGPRTFVIYDESHINILAYDTPVKPVLSVKFSLKWEPFAFLSVAAELNVVKDWNEQYVGGPTDVVVTMPLKLAVRGQLLVQARF